MKKRGASKKTRPMFVHPLVFKNKLRNVVKKTPRKMVIMRLPQGTGVQNVELRDQLFEEIRNAERENARTLNLEREAKDYMQRTGAELMDADALNKMMTYVSRTNPTAQFPEGILRELAKKRRTLIIPDVFRPQINRYAELHGLGAIGGPSLRKRTLTGTYLSPRELVKNSMISAGQEIDRGEENEKQEDVKATLREIYGEEYDKAHGVPPSRRIVDEAIPKYIDTRFLKIPQGVGNVFKFHLCP